MPFVPDLLQALPPPPAVPPPAALSVSGPVPAAAGTVRDAVVFDSFFEQPRSRETLRGEGADGLFSATIVSNHAHIQPRLLLLLLTEFHDMNVKYPTNLFGEAIFVTVTKNLENIERRV